jgi:hypothetical protein
MESPTTIPIRRERLFSEATLELPVAMGVAHIIFHPSLLTSWADDVGAAHRYYATWPL